MIPPRYWIHTETHEHMRYDPHREAPSNEWAYAQGDTDGWLRTPFDGSMPMPAKALCDVKTGTGEILLNKEVGLVPWSKAEHYRPIDKPAPGLEGPCLYVAGPYRAASAPAINKNISKAQLVASAAASRGWFPMVPHNMSIGFEQAGDEAYWLAHTMSVMERCDALVLIDGWQRSAGTVAEVARARELSIPVYEGLYALPSYPLREANTDRLNLRCS